MRTGARRATAWGGGAGDINDHLNVLSRAFRLAVDASLTRSNPFRLDARLDYASKPFLVLDAGDEPKRAVEAVSAGQVSRPAGRDGRMKLLVKTSQRRRL